MALFFKLFYMQVLKAPAYPIGIDTGLKVGKTLQQRGLATDAGRQGVHALQGISRARCSEACLSRPRSCSRRRSLNNNRQRQGRRTSPTNEDGRGECENHNRESCAAQARSHAQPRAATRRRPHLPRCISELLLPFAACIKLRL
ncbi:hypothetical protein, conserved [Eimeria necatrix]|uniref:Uncharacterized protein n=1 Tax=Eimeria necatrix TaxID=51315 RepID=U6MID8_9EIME|nr:hypothetical protein, conserved [Eimeria necatrix]CDJ62214.1 hypothetical protein, conserved [Eimeria necatrix]